MDILREFLSSRCKPYQPVNGDYAWELLTKKMDDLKERDRFTEASSAISRCIHMIHKASKDGKPPFAVLPNSDSLTACEAVIDDLKLLASDHLCRSDFVKGLTNTEITIPLLIIWKLHKAGILQISTYVFRKIEPGEENLVVDAILWLLSNAKDSNEYGDVAKDTFCSLLIASQSGTVNSELAAICASILKKCADDIVNLVMSPKEQCAITPVSPDLSYLTCSELWSCGSEAMEQFALAHLLHLLGEQYASNSGQTLIDAVVFQEKCLLNKASSSSFDSLIAALVSSLGTDKIINQLAVAVVRPAVNWKTIFLLVAVLLSKRPECCNDMKKLTDELIQVGLEGGRQNELAAGFLIARHCCICDSKSFGSYVVWFSSYFGINSATARNPVQFQSLLKLLTEIVPVESAENLRIHINKVPLAPTSCHSILHDYTVLARTRLADLNESSELTGLFANSTRDSVSGQDSKQGDIVRVLRHFQSTREIMKPVLEASVLRRLYFRNVFLADLLDISGTTDTSINLEDYGLSEEIRHDFILALKEMGKIPEKLFRVYLEKRSSQEISISSGNDKDTVKCVKSSEVNQPKKKKCLSKKQANGPKKSEIHDHLK